MVLNGTKTSKYRILSKIYHTDDQANRMIDYDLRMLFVQRNWLSFLNQRKEKKRKDT